MILYPILVRSCGPFAITRVQRKVAKREARVFSTIMLMPDLRLRWRWRKETGSGWSEGVLLKKVALCYLCRA